MNNGRNLNELHNARNVNVLQIEQAGAPRIQANVIGLDIRFVENVFAAKEQIFLRFVARNQHLTNYISIVCHIPSPVEEVIFQVRTPEHQRNDANRPNDN